MPSTTLLDTPLPTLPTLSESMELLPLLFQLLPVPMLVLEGMLPTLLALFMLPREKPKLNPRPCMALMVMVLDTQALVTDIMLATQPLDMDIILDTLHMVTHMDTLTVMDMDIMLVTQPLDMDIIL